MGTVTTCIQQTGNSCCNYHTFSVFDACQVSGESGVIPLQFMLIRSCQGGLAGVVCSRAPDSLHARKIECETCNQGAPCSASSAATYRLLLAADTLQRCWQQSHHQPAVMYTQGQRQSTPATPTIHITYNHPTTVHKVSPQQFTTRTTGQSQGIAEDRLQAGSRTRNKRVIR